MTYDPAQLDKAKLPLRTRIARRIAGSSWPQPPPDEDTTARGYSEQALESIRQQFFNVSDERYQVYKDARKMDETMDEVATALDMAADNAFSTEAGQEEPFTIAYLEESTPKYLRAIVEGVLARTDWRNKGMEIARELLLMGDNFLQYVVDDHYDIVRLMYMPQESMIRNEDEVGLLLRGNTPGEYAFEQHYPDGGAFIAGFKPHEILHLRWKKSGRRVYGRSLLYTARASWKKLQAMEEALVINWITRAFARLLFTLDITGKGPNEALAAMTEFKRSLQTRKIAKDVTGMEQLAVVADIFMGRAYHEMGGRAEPSLTDAKVLDTSSTGYQQIRPIEYYRDRILATLRTPKAYLGLEEDINAKATLVQEDRRYQRFIRSIQAVIGQGIRQTIDLQLALRGIEPRRVPYVVQWYAPTWGDLIEDAQALNNYAQADTQYLALGIIDKEWVAKRHLRMSTAEFAAVLERVERDGLTTMPPKADAAAEPEDNEGDEPEEGATS